MDDRIGNFEVGKEFDAILVDVEAPDTLLDIFAKASTQGHFHNDEMVSKSAKICLYNYFDFSKLCCFLRCATMRPMSLTSIAQSPNITSANFS